MRMTLEQLKALSDNELVFHWGQGSFPFDLACCSTCLTQHTYTYYVPCKNAQHEVFADLLKSVLGENFSVAKAKVRPHLEELYALRLYFDSLYPQSAEPLAAAPAEQQAMEAPVEQI